MFLKLSKMLAIINFEIFIWVKDMTQMMESEDSKEKKHFILSCHQGTLSGEISLLMIPWCQIATAGLNSDGWLWLM